MSEEEKLTLDVDVTYEDDDLDRLERDLDAIDDAITRSGDGKDRDAVDINVKISGFSESIGKLKALDSAIENIDDDLDIDVDVTENVSRTVSSDGGRFDDFDNLTDEGGFFYPGQLADGPFTNLQDLDGNDLLELWSDDTDISILNNLRDLWGEVEAQKTQLGDRGNVEQFRNLQSLTEGDISTLVEGIRGDFNHEGEVSVDRLNGGMRLESFDPSNLATFQDTSRISSFDLNRDLYGLDTRDTQLTDRGNIERFRNLQTLSGSDLANTVETIDKNFKHEENILDRFDDSVNKFNRGVSVGSIDSDSRLSSVRNPGLAAEGLDSAASVDLVKSQRRASKAAGYSESMFQKLSRQGNKLFSEIVHARFTMQAFHRIFAAMVPLIVVMVGALPAAISALIGLAGAAIAAAVALGGIGLLGVGGIMLTESGALDTEPLINQLRNVADSFLTAFSPLMESMAPLAMDFFDQIGQMAGPLAVASTELLSLRGTFLSVTNSITGYLPRLVSGLVRFADAAIPFLSGIKNVLGSTNFLAFFAKQLDRMAVTLKALAFSVINFLPALIFLSEGFLTATAAVLTLFGALGFILKRFPKLTAFIGFVISGLLIFLTVTSLVSVASYAARSGLVTLAASFFKTGVAALWNAATLQASTYAIIAFYSAVTLGIAGLVAFGTAFNSLRDSISGANDALRNFGELSDQSLNGGISGPSGGGSRFGSSGNNSYTTVINANGRDDAARQQYSNSYEQRQQVDSVFGG